MKPRYFKGLNDTSRAFRDSLLFKPQVMDDLRDNGGYSGKIQPKNAEERKACFAAY